MKRKKYQKGGPPNKKNKSIRDRLVSGLDKANEQFYNAMNTNMDRLNWQQDEDGNWYTTSGIIPTMANLAGSLPAAAGVIGTGLASNVLQKLNLPNIKSNPDWKEDMKKNAAKFKMPGAMYKNGGEKKASSYSVKNKKRKKVEKWSTGDVESKRVTRKKRKSTTVKERNDMLSDLQYNAPGDLNPTKIKREAMEYGDKKVTKRRFKSKTSNKSGKETKRREKIVYDDGNQMKKRKQRKIRFGKNKGKIKSKTIHYNKGKRTKTVEYRDATDKTKLQKGGFLEAPITRLFED